MTSKVELNGSGSGPPAPRGLPARSGTGRACSAACACASWSPSSCSWRLSAACRSSCCATCSLDRLDEEIHTGLEREAEEFDILAGGIESDGPGEPFGDDFAAVFDLYFAREVPDEGETLLAFVEAALHRTRELAERRARRATRRAPSPTGCPRPRTEEGTLDTGAGRARYVALPLTAGGHDALFVAANFPAIERDEIDDAVRTQAVVQFAMIVVASLLGLALAGRVLRPLSTLADTAQTISATDLTRRIPVRGEGRGVAHRHGVQRDARTDRTRERHAAAVPRRRQPRAALADDGDPRARRAARAGDRSATSATRW